ncbi:hypothetical protein QQF64_027281 [Cirrhinus molitorella]|uniref:Uncharacterized protein n=1 Tax=Cirrhinus molitorella TaxID=172907 RepID=A0ABR3NCJ9_9TELE
MYFHRIASAQGVFLEPLGVILNWACVLGRACCVSLGRGTECECVPAGSPWRGQGFAWALFKTLIFKAFCFKLPCPARMTTEGMNSAG